MNATCSAGILQPQRVSDLGRLLNYEITPPLDSTARGVSNTSMAPAHLQGASFKHLHGACPFARRPHLAMCEAILQPHWTSCQASGAFYSLQGSIFKVPSSSARCHHQHSRYLRGVFLITLCQLQGSSSFNTQGFMCPSTSKRLQFSSPSCVSKEM